MSEIVPILSGVISGLTILIPAYVIAKRWKENTINDIFDMVLERINDKEVQEKVFQAGFLFASGASKAIPVLNGQAGKKFKLEDLITQGLASFIGSKFNPESMQNPQQQDALPAKW